MKNGVADLFAEILASTPKRRWHDGKSDPSQVFVFGSNLLGEHAGGAARFAHVNRGARDGQGQGYAEAYPVWNDNQPVMSYALPTMAVIGVPLTLEGVKAAVTLFKAFAYVREDLEFFVTPVGTGIAGFKHEDIAPLFADSPLNCILPREWETIINGNG